MAVLLAAGCVPTAAPVTSPTPLGTPTGAAPGVSPSPGPGGLGLTVPLEKGIATTDVQVNLDTDLLVVERVYPNARTIPPQQVSTDGGHTWTTAEIPVPMVWYYAADRKASYTDVDHRLHTYDFASGRLTTTVVKKGTLAAVGRDVLVSFDLQGTSESEPPHVNWAHAQDLRSGQVRPLDYHGRQKDDLWEVSAYVDTGAVTLIASIGHEEGVLDLLPLDGGAALPELRVPLLRAAALRGDHVVYVVRSATGTQVCSRPLDGWPAEPKCVDLGITIDRFARVHLEVGKGWASVVVPAANADVADPPVEFVMWGEESPESVRRVDAGDSSARLDGTGRSARPMATVGSGPSGSVGRLQPDGSVETAFGFVGPGVPHEVVALAAAADRVMGLEPDPERPDWTRSVGTDRIGEQVALPVVAGAGNVSAGRTMLSTETEVLLLDRGQIVRRWGPTAEDAPVQGSLTGPYFVTCRPRWYCRESQLRRADGLVVPGYQSLNPLGPRFGTLVAVSSTPGLPPYRVVDLADPGRSWTFASPASWHGGSVEFVGMWGDWLLLRQIGSMNDHFASAVVNYRTGETKVIDLELPQLIGDGYAVLLADHNAYDTGGLVVWDFLHNRRTRLAVGSSLAVTSTGDPVVATDGSRRLVYATLTDLVVVPIEGAGRSRVRTLGVVAAEEVGVGSEWTFELDATKALAAGTLELRSKGKLVRALPFPASEDGSLRLSWDGRDDDGVPVPAGRYTWQVKAAGADGTGALVRVDGSAGVSGSVVVS